MKSSSFFGDLLVALKGTFRVPIEVAYSVIIYRFTPRFVENLQVAFWDTVGLRGAYIHHASSGTNWLPPRGPLRWHLRVHVPSSSNLHLTLRFVEDPQVARWRTVGLRGGYTHQASSRTSRLSPRWPWSAHAHTYFMPFPFFWLFLCGFWVS